MSFIGLFFYFFREKGGRLLFGKKKLLVLSVSIYIELISGFRVFEDFSSGVPQRSDFLVFLFFGVR